jgi:hypothetical protein
MRSRPLALLVCAAAAACSDTPMPGNQVLGRYEFQAVPLEASCAIDVSQDGFTFAGTFSRDSETGEAWYRLNSIVREATFDGQVATATYSAPRVFIGGCDGGDCCAGCTTELRETVVVGLMSKSMNDAAGDACPANPLDGGMPSGPGVTPPGPADTGFDAVRACGELLDEVVATPNEGESCDPRCGQCRLKYTLIGARR